MSPPIQDTIGIDLEYVTKYLTIFEAHKGFLVGIPLNLTLA